MKKQELEALNLTTEQIKRVQQLHGRDLEAMKRKQGASSSGKEIKQAVRAALVLIESPEKLQSVFEFVAKTAAEELKKNIHSV